MQLCFFSGRVIRAFLIMASLSFFVSVDLASANRHTQEDQQANAQYDHDRLKPYKACKKEFNNYLEEQKDLGPRGLGRGLVEMANIYAGKPLRYEIRYRQYEICMGVKTYRPYQAEVLMKMNIKRKKYIDDTFSSIFEMTPNEAAANAKAAEEAAKKAAIDDVFSVLDLIDEEVRAAMEKDAKNKAAEERAEKRMAAEDAKIKAAKEKAAAQETKEDSSYILTNESLMEIFGDLTKQYPELANLKMEISIPANLTQMKTINSQGITRTMYCNPKCTLGSPMLQSYRTGVDMGIPLIIYHRISEALNEVFVGESPFNRSDIIKIGIICYNEMAMTINDPNFNLAFAMTPEQLTRIRLQLKKDQATSNNNSGGMADGYDREEDHDEEAY